MQASEKDRPPSREHLLHLLYEAAELEHNLMCTYLYAAFSLRDGATDLSREESEAVLRWRSVILKVAIEEMGHLSAVWNITAALGGSPRFGRGNFPLDPGTLPAGLVVKLAPFNQEVLQHFIHLERPEGSAEREGKGFEPERLFKRGDPRPRLIPMALDYETVGIFYTSLDLQLRAFVEHVGERAAFCGDPALQLSAAEVNLLGAEPVICSKTALAAFRAIVRQGEGAPEHSIDSHFQRFVGIREEFAALKAKNPDFSPAFPAAVNPVLRPPPRPEDRIWLEDEAAAATVDLANTGYGLMLRLLAYCYLVPRPSPQRALAVELSLGLMRAVTHLGERAARLPAGPSHPGCNAGMSFTALRDASALPPGASASRFFCERLEEMAAAAAELDRTGDHRTKSALRILKDLAQRAPFGFAAAEPISISPRSQPTAADLAAAPATTPTPTVLDGIEQIEGRGLTLLYEGKRCIHARFCVTGAPNVFLANVQGPWIRPDAVETEFLVEIAHACPSGAIRYRRKDGHPNEAPPLVNLISIREAGPYAVRGDLRIDGQAANTRATLCRCGASKNKPYCDGSHKETGFSASGEPSTGHAEMLLVRDGPLSVDPQIDGPLQVRGNMEITSGTGRVVARLVQARLCRCGASDNKPFCDGSHARIGFKSS